VGLQENGTDQLVETGRTLGGELIDFWYNIYIKFLLIASMLQRTIFMQSQMVYMCVIVMMKIH